MRLASAVAASTSRIRLGFSGLTLLLCNPLRLAEEIATLDLLSGGRVDLGIGGADEEHGLDTMIECWAGHQRPHPPIYLTGHTDETIIWAAQWGYALIQPAIQSPASLRHCLGLFAAHGGQIARSPVERFCFVAESDAQARKQAWSFVVELAARLRRSAVGGNEHPLTSDDDVEPERFYQETAIVGSARWCCHE